MKSYGAPWEEARFQENKLGYQVAYAGFLTGSQWGSVWWL